MTTATSLDLDPEHQRPDRRPQPLNSLVAAAQRITSKDITNQRRGSTAKPWQDDAWDMYDLVGEQRFLASTLAGRMSQARLFVGKLADDPSQPPEPLEDGDVISDVLNAVGASPAARAQILYRLGVNMFVAGDGWLVGIPRYLMPESMRHPETVDPDDPIEQMPEEPDQLVIEELDWRMLSVSEISANGTGELTLMLGETSDEHVVTTADNVYLVRVWRPHPRKSWEADSPTRSSLGVLRELVGLTMHISAQVDSRLAGAGLLVVPQSAQRALNIAAGLEEDDESDPFTEALMEAMLTPINDRANASALVPLVVTVPDDVVEKFNYMTFAKPLDAEARSLRDEAIRRLALGQDAPPELLLGTAGMNHWGAWLVREDVVTTHVEPPLALISDALTTQYLWPVLMDAGKSEEEAHKYVIWYDVSHMVTRPNRSGDAKDLHERGVLSNETLLEATGFSDQDQPASSSISTEAALAMEMVRSTPSLMVDPGLPVVVEQIRMVLAGEVVPWEPGAEPANDGDGEESPFGEPSDAEPEPAPGETAEQATPTGSIPEGGPVLDEGEAQ